MAGVITVRLAQGVWETVVRLKGFLEVLLGVLSSQSLNSADCSRAA